MKNTIFAIAACAGLLWGSLAYAVTPTRALNGITDQTASSALGQLGILDPSTYHCYWNDFDDYAAADWVLTTGETGGGSATEVLSDAVNGILVVTNDDGDDENDFFQWSGADDTGGVESFKLVTGKKTWFKTRLKVSDATQSDLVVGLQIVDSSPLDVTDGVFIQKDDGDANLDFHGEKDNADIVTGTAFATLSDNTYAELAWYWDGSSTWRVYKDDALAYSSSTSTFPDDEELTISFGIQNGAAAAKVLSVDYILACQER